MWQEEDNVMWVRAPHHGLGGNMHILSVALTHAYTHGKALRASRLEKVLVTDLLIKLADVDQCGGCRHALGTRVP
ncbi:MAG: hypothetical protein ACPIOQ_78745, partial [Promethearchaeia archaeon]